jgi:opacity protein-like surface antigen
MKKLLLAVCAIAMCASAYAQDKKDKKDVAPAQTPVVQEAPAEKATWPVPVALNSTKNIDVVGMRFTLPYGDSEHVTGFDLGLFGRCRYFEGFQLNLVRNDVKDILAGVQIGLYNSAGRADLCGVQIGLWNEVGSISGVQVGLVNLAESVYGLQVGVINRTETAYGFQVGGVNAIRDSQMPFLPLVNIGLDQFARY